MIDLVFVQHLNTYYLSVNKIYEIKCDEYKGNNISLKTLSFDTATIKGYIKNFNCKLHTCSIVFDKVIFENCIFSENSFIDSSSFNNCTFINCEFFGNFRWITFNKCHFKNIFFNMEYVRGTSLKKNCVFNNVNINIKMIDDYVWIFGKRYSNNTYGNELILKFF